MNQWKFTPYDLTKWNKAEERVLFVGSEPNGNNPHGAILDKVCAETSR